MTARLSKNIDRLAREANVELTPEIRNFAWLVTQDALQGFWEAAQQYAAYEKGKVDSFLKGKT